MATPRLNLWRWFYIGILYEEETQVQTSAQASNDSEPRPFHFAAMYASVASILWYLVSIRKAALVGWQNSLMDVVHEVGANMRNLNVFNVGVSDAKQTCAHAAVVIHHGRRGYVYEAASACLHAAASYVWRHADQIRAHCKLHDYNLDAQFALTPDFYFKELTAFSREAAPPTIHIAIESDYAYKNDGVVLRSMPGVTVPVRVAFPRPFVRDPDYIPDFPVGHVFLGSVTDGDFSMWRRWILQLPKSFRLLLGQDTAPGSDGVRFCDRHKGVRLVSTGETHFKKAFESRRFSTVLFDKEHCLGLVEWKLLASLWASSRSRSLPRPPRRGAGILGAYSR